jgi:hypothetical protein
VLGLIQDGLGLGVVDARCVDRCDSSHILEDGAIDVEDHELRLSAVGLAGRVFDDGRLIAAHGDDHGLLEWVGVHRCSLVDATPMLATA